jgi:hypothetical protein
MTGYSYNVNKMTSIMTIFKGERKLCIISDVTQRKQAKHLFEEFLDKIKG